MGYKRLVKIANTWMMVSMSLLLVTLVLGQQNAVNRRRIERQQKNIYEYKMRLSHIQKDLNDFDLYRFKEDVFTRKYPLFSRIAEVAYRKGHRMKVDPLLVLGIIETESAFNPYAVSSRGAYGLMQINYAVWKNELNIDFKRLMDIEYNIELGIRIIRHYLAKADGNVLRALHLYNNGYLYNNTKYNFKVISTAFLRDNPLLKKQSESF